MPILQLGVGSESKFVPLHAREDQKHADLVWKQIDRVASIFPGSERVIEFGFDCLALVYPFLVWDEAVAGTRAELGWPHTGDTHLTAPAVRFTTTRHRA
jgi:hypothetical protein